MRALLARADQLLDELGLAGVAETSAVLEAGLEARLLRYAEAIEARLNNLEPRLTYYLGLVGRRCGLWWRPWRGRCGRLGCRSSCRIVRWPLDERRLADRGCCGSADRARRRRWWTFAGFRANAVLAQRFGRAFIAGSPVHLRP